MPAIREAPGDPLVDVAFRVYADFVEVLAVVLQYRHELDAASSAAQAPAGQRA